MREAEAVALKRWERIRIIEDYSNKAKETGLAKDLHKYARDKVTKSSGLREQFQKAAQEIWRRQKAALRSGPHPTAVADNKQADDGDESSDDDFAGDIEKSLAAREASNACLDGSRSSKALAERKQEENDHREFSSMSSFLKKITSAPAGPLSAADVDSSAKKRKVEVTGNVVQPASRTEESVATVNQLEGSNVEEIHHLGMTPRPRRAVKRVSRIVRSDGSESVRIELIFIDSEVDRVECLSYRSKIDRESKRYANSSQSSEEAAAVALDDDDALDFLPTSVNAMKINLTKLRQAVDQNNALKKKEAAAVAEGNEQLLIIRGTGNSCSVGKSAGKSNKRTLLSLVNSRIPRVSFAVRLEKEVMELWRTKLANVFWYPVNFMNAPGYYSRIQHPICLSDIREKIASYQ
jgi:hypothetical protein